MKASLGQIVTIEERSEVTMGFSTIEIVDVRHAFGGSGNSVALNEVNFSAGRGEFLSIVGPSGCGKSTLLTLISGLASPTSGSVSVLGSPVTGLRLDVGFILQRDALLPWRTALQNVALPLRFRGVGRREAERRAADWLVRVGLDGAGQRYPHQLSGGMRKRVAIAATMIYEPQILLMDEPFSALDVQSRTLMENDLLSIWAETKPTVVFITHDLEEAIGLSDRVLVMSRTPGRIVGSHTIDLPRPRNLLDVRLDPSFTGIYETIWEQLRREVVGPGDTEREQGGAGD